MNIFKRIYNKFSKKKYLPSTLRDYPDQFRTDVVLKALTDYVEILEGLFTITTADTHKINKAGICIECKHKFFVSYKAWKTNERDIKDLTCKEVIMKDVIG